MACPKNFKFSPQNKIDITVIFWNRTLSTLRIRILSVDYTISICNSFKRHNKVIIKFHLCPQNATPPASASTASRHVHVTWLTQQTATTSTAAVPVTQTGRDPPARMMLMSVQSTPTSALTHWKTATTPQALLSAGVLPDTWRTLTLGGPVKVRCLTRHMDSFENPYIGLCSFSQIAFHQFT